MRPIDKPAIRVDLASPRVAVAVLGERPPDDDEWADYVETTTALADPRTLVFTAGGAPTTTQRADLEPRADQQRARLAVINSGVGTVARWFADLGPSDPAEVETTRVFTPDQLEDAFGFLQLSARERARAISLARRLARELELDAWPWRRVAVARA